MLSSDPSPVLSLKKKKKIIWLPWVLVAAYAIFHHCRSRQDLLVVMYRVEFPDQGSNPDPLHWEYLRHGTTREIPPFSLIFVVIPLNSACAYVLSLQSRLTLCDPMNYSPPGSSVPRILQEGILEWVAMPSFRGSSQPRNQSCVSYIYCIGRQVLND